MFMILNFMAIIFKIFNDFVRKGLQKRKRRVERLSILTRKRIAMH